MSINYLVTGTKADNAEFLAKERNNIGLIKQKLINIGYSPGEVEHLVHQFTGGGKIKHLNVEELRELKKLLLQQLDLAEKCLQIP